jgi:ribosome-associated translation inhibitor RaiA
MAKRNCKARLRYLKEEQKRFIEKRAELERQFNQANNEKKDMYNKFEIAIDQLRSRANYKN